MDTPEINTSGAERQSFDDFYRAHRSPIFRALLVTLRNPEAAAEAVDEAMTRALERWDKLVAYDKPERWVFRVGPNCAISAWRSTKPETLDILVEPSAEGRLPDPEVSKALARLSARFRTVLVYEGGSQVLTPPMSREQRELWIRSFRGETTPDGFLRLYGDEPLRVVIAGEYPSPMSMSFTGFGGSIELVPGECQAGFVGDGIGIGEFVHWCDESGLISVRIVGTPEFQQAVYDGLEIGMVRLVGIEGPNANGSYAHLLDELERARTRWEQANFKDAYRLTVRGHISIAAVDFTALVRDGQVTIERGDPRPLDDPLTVESLFDLVEAAVALDGPVSARFHPEFAYPTWIRWGAAPEVDDGAGLTIQFEPLSD